MAGRELEWVVEHDRMARKWVYKMNADTLVEELGDRQFIFGLWNRLFGCWTINPYTGNAWKPDAR
jgi:hypothetical protein